MSKRAVGGTPPDTPDSKRVKTIDDSIAFANEVQSNLNSASEPAHLGVPQPAVESESSSNAIAESPSASTAASSAKPAKEKRKAKQNMSKNAVKIDRRGKRAVQQERVPWNTPRQSEGAEGEKKERLAKRKSAVLIGFCGSGYQGMQVQTSQKDSKTIEGDLFEAFVKAGAVSADNSDDPSKVSLGRAARTDSGVHAAGNLVSLKLITSIPSLEESGITLISHINSFLPPTIRVWDILRTTNNFNARTSCDSRVYEYLFPSYILMPPLPTSPLGARLTRTSTPSDSLSSASYSESAGADQIREAYRASEAQVAQVQQLLNGLEGTHNFHNYTVGRDFKDRAAHRYMIKLKAREPQVYDGLEWISIQFHGQSFMLHQRKMIGLVMLAARTSTPPSLIPETFGPNKIHIPKAPALGLLLEQPQFGVYNSRVDQSNAQVLQSQSTKTSAEETTPDANAADVEVPDVEAKENSATVKDKLDFEPHRALIDAFKKDYIYTSMRQEEAQSHIFARWVSSVDGYSGSDFDYLNEKGTIPASAVMKKGEQRADAFREPPEDEGTSGKGKLEDMEG